MARAKPPTPRWVWYCLRTSNCVPLDPEVYPLTVYEGRTLPCPNWVCKRPTGGMHMNARLGQIDIHVSKAPTGRHEMQWSCEFQTSIVAKSWCEGFADLLAQEEVFLGKIFHNGTVLDQWFTIHQPSPPLLLSTEGRIYPTCPICGEEYTTLHGSVYFADRRALDRKVIVNFKGVFIREDEVINRGIRAPIGAFKPRLVKFRENPPEQIAAPYP